MIKNIILDMGNVLLVYDPAVPLRLYCKTEEEQAVIRKELFEGPEWVQGDLGYMTDAQKYESVRLRVPESMHDALKKCVYGWHVCLRPVPGAMEFCRYARSRGLGLYVLSNVAPDFYEYFETFAPFDFFDGIVVSSDLHRVKPEEAIYRHVLETYRLLPEDCLFIDDMEENVRGAGRLGIHGAVFRNDFDAICKEYAI